MIEQLQLATCLVVKCSYQPRVTLFLFEAGVYYVTLRSVTVNGGPVNTLTAVFRRDVWTGPVDDAAVPNNHLNSNILRLFLISQQMPVCWRGMKYMHMKSCVASLCIADLFGSVQWCSDICSAQLSVEKDKPSVLGLYGFMCFLRVFLTRKSL